MKHFFIFVAVVFLGVYLLILNRPQNQKDDKPVLRIYAYNSFTSQWGPGPALKKLFEKDCNCQVEFAEGSDAGILLQRLKLEGESLGADLVIGFDQFDLQKASSTLKWQQLNVGTLDFDESVKTALISKNFIPYDWGALSFMTRKADGLPSTLDDLLKPEFSRKILIQDPRSSSPGFQFLYWVIKSKGEEQGFEFIQKLFDQVNTITPSWSAAIGIFNKNPSNLVFTYVTSPIYYQLEEKKNDYRILDFEEALPIQFEYLGVPDFCRQCDLSEKFVNLMLSLEGQKILMQKNYMLPVIKGVKDGTPFAEAMAKRKWLNFEVPADAEVDRLIKRWAEIRRGQGN